MSMTQTQQHNVPSLRFPEFSGEWETDRLSKSNLMVVDGDRGVNYPQKKDFSQSGYCLFLNAKNVTKLGFSFEGTAFISQDKDAAMSKGRLNRGDLLLTTRGSVGHVALFDNTVKYENIRINSGMVILRSTDRVDSSSFLFFLFNSPNITTQIKKTAFGSAQPQLTVKEIKRFWLSKPTLPEQQKIASFLSSVDGKIEQLGKKKALLEQYKKGMMQKLFSQELRFKNAQGNDFPDWEEKRLGELAKITTGKLDANAMVPEGPYRFYTCAKQHFQIDEYAFDTDALLISGNGANVGYVHRYNGKFNAYQRTYVLDGFFETILYVKFYLDFFLKRRIDVEKKDGNTPYIVMSTLSEMLISLPHPSEQQKIADFLSSVDRKIEFAATEFDKAKAFKKGLLQQMYI